MATIITVGASGPRGRPGIVWREGWSASSDYYVGDAVKHGLASYICIVYTPANPSGQPNVLTSNWDILVDANDVAPTGADIKASYELEANAFTDTQFTKLAGIETAANVTDSTNVASAGAVMESDTTIALMGFVLDEDTLTSNSETKLATQQSIKAYVDANTIALSGTDIKASYELEAFAFTDAQFNKLSGIETAADVTDVVNVTAAGALMDSELAGLAAVKATTGTFLTADETKLDGIETAANNYSHPTGDGSLHVINTSTTNNGKVLTAGSTAGSLTWETPVDTDTTYSVGDGGLTQINFTTADQTKLDGIETAADVTDVVNVTAAGAVMESDTTINSMGFVLDEDTLSSDSATKLATQQSIKAYVDAEISFALTSEMSYKGSYNASTNSPDLDTTPIDTSIGDVYTVTVAGTFFTASVGIGDVLISEKALALLETDWTIVSKSLDAASIKTLYEGNADTNEFSDAEQTKLSGIETAADVTDSTNVASAGAVMESDTTTVSMSFVLDEDTLSSDSATKVPTQQSVKAYVDSATAGITLIDGGTA